MLPKDIKKYFKIKDINKIVYFMENDKKNVDKYINLVLLSSIGKTIYYKINKKFLKKFFNDQLKK